VLLGRTPAKTSNSMLQTRLRTPRGQKGATDAGRTVTLAVIDHYFGLRSITEVS
jgi:hypothetical protein